MHVVLHCICLEARDMGSPAQHGTLARGRTAATAGVPDGSARTKVADAASGVGA